MALEFWAAQHVTSGETTMKIGTTPHADLVYTNNVYVGENNELGLKNGDLISITGASEGLFHVGTHEKVPADVVALNSLHRRAIRVSLNDEVAVRKRSSEDFDVIDTVHVEVGLAGRNKLAKLDLDLKEFTQWFCKRFRGHALAEGAQLAVDYMNDKLFVTPTKVTALNTAAVGSTSSDTHRPTQRVPFGIVTQTMQIIGTRAADSKNLNIIAGPDGSSSTRTDIFRADFDWEKLGIGGLGEEFSTIFRRAFAPRIFPRDLVKKLGVKYVRGILLYGPPGCGKTLIARRIGKMLNCVEPKVVNGPEILNKYVGQSEENIRNLFADAESDELANGDNSDLHLIIFDELDAICRQRGTVGGGTGVHDTVVNQLLSKMDGVDQLNNILIIGMTNRKDMIDEALLRPGRFEVHMEIGLPDEKGRAQILSIHTHGMHENNMLSKDVDLLEIAARTKNFSGAEIEGLVKSATSYAMDRHVNREQLNEADAVKEVMVTMNDFDSALKEVIPAFGAIQDEMTPLLGEGLIDYGASYQHVREVLDHAIKQVKYSDRTHLLTVLLEGQHGSGKTAIAADTAVSSDFPFSKVLSAESLLGRPEHDKLQRIAKMFHDAHRSPLSLLLLDDLERLIEYVDVGPRFSNMLLQALLVLLRKQPPQDKKKGHVVDRKLLVIGTTNDYPALERLGLADAFNLVLTVPPLTTDAEKMAVLRELNVFKNDDDYATAVQAIPGSITVKKFQLAIEMARQKGAEDMTPADLSTSLLDLVGGRHA